MFYVSNEISKIPGIIDTFPHKDLAGHGRWSIMTDTTHFKPVITALETNLATWTRSYCNWENITLGTLPPPLSHLGHNPMKIILTPPSPLICLHSQICMHSMTILAINHPNLMVPPLNHGNLLPPRHMPQPSP